MKAAGMMKVSKEKKNNIIRFGLTYFWCLFTCMVFGPLELYFSNIEEFWFGLSDFLPILSAVSAIIWAILMILHFILPKNVTSIVLKILWILSVCLYIQGDFIPVSYKVLDGTEIDWSSYGNYGYINTGMWVIVIAVFAFFCFKYGKQVEKIIPALSAAMLVMQCTAVVSLVIPAYRNGMDTEYYLTDKGMYEIGSDQNTIVFLLDAFDSEVFYELLETQDDKWVSQFDGFHYYHDTAGGATRTRYAIPYIFSGQPYIKEETYKEYLNRSSRESPLYEQIGKRKVNACLYTEPAYIGTSQVSRIDNYESMELKTSSVWGLTGDMLKLAAFRNFPHELKRYFWMYSGELEEWKTSEDNGSKPYRFDDVEFYNRLISNRLTTGGYAESFRFYHLSGAHEPYTMDENAERVDLIEEEGEMRQALGCIKIVNEYMDQLKELDLYDSAAVIIMSDHGCGRGIEQNPLFLMKPPGGSGRLKSSDFAFSYANLQEVFSASLQGESRYPEEYVDEINPRFFYTGGGDNAVLNYTEYVIKGAAYDEKCIESTGNVFHGSMDAADYRYELGTMLTTEDWSLNAHCISGFRGNEITHTWTNEQEAVMRFDLSGKYNNLEVAMNYWVHGSSQRVNIYADDMPVLSYIADKAETKTFYISKEYIKDNRLEIKFEFPDVEASLDSNLALAMKSMVISSTDGNAERLNQAAGYVLGETLSFGDRAEEYCIYGFSWTEGDRMWTDSKQAMMKFDIIGEFRKLSVKMEYRAYGSKQRVAVHANDHKVEQFTAKGEEEHVFVIPGEYVEDGFLELRFDLPDAVSPNARGQSGDKRELALFMKNLTIQAGTDYVYRLNETIPFEETAERYFVRGFSNYEDGFTWTDGKEAVLQFDIEEDFEDLSASIRYGTYNAPQHVIVYANKHKIAEFTAEGEEERDIHIPGGFIKDGQLELKLELPDAVSPKIRGESEDERNLALAMKEITISAVE